MRLYLEHLSQCADDGEAMLNRYYTIQIKACFNAMETYHFGFNQVI